MYEVLQKYLPKNLCLLAAPALSIYLMAYALLYDFRSSAANMSYWVYSERAPEWAETCLYYGFYPAYFSHQRMLGGQRHNYDRIPAYGWEP